MVTEGWGSADTRVLMRNVEGSLIGPPSVASDQIPHGRHETPEEREDRNLTDLLQELRVAAVGIQVLFGFLLSLPFSARFVKLDAAEKHLYLACLILAALAIGLLCAPVAFHRLVFRQHKKGRLVRTANVLALAGLAVIGLALSSSVLLVSKVLFNGPAVIGISAAVLCMFVVLWFAMPLVLGRLATQREDNYEGV